MKIFTMNIATGCTAILKHSFQIHDFRKSLKIGINIHQDKDNYFFFGLQDHSYC